MKLLITILLIWFLCCAFSQGQQKPPLGTQLNRSHPLAQGLVLMLPLNENSGRIVNCVTGKTYPSYNTAWDGKGQKYNLSSAYTELGTAFSFGVRRFTVAILFSPTATESATFPLNARGSGLQGYELIVNPANTITWRFLCAGFAQVASTPVTITGNGKLYMVVASFGGSGGVCSFYVDGNFIAPVIPIQAAINNSVSLALGYRSGTGNYYGGSISSVWIWAYRALSNDDVHAFSSAPYAMFKTGLAQRPYLNYGSTGAPAVEQKRIPTKAMLLSERDRWKRFLEDRVARTGIEDVVR